MNVPCTTMKLKSKLILSMLMAALIPLTISMGLSLWDTAQQTRHLTIEAAQSELRSMAGKLSAYFEQHIATVNTYARAPVIRSMSHDRFDPFLKNEIQYHKNNFEKFLIGRPDGHYYYTSGGNPHLGGVASFNDTSPEAQAKSIAKRDYWLYTVGENKRNLNRSYVSNPMISYTTGAKQIVIAASILNKDGTIKGMFGGSLPWDNIEQRITLLRNELENHLPWDTQLFVISPEGIYWYHWDTDKVVHIKKDARGRPQLNEFGEKISIRSKITDDPNPEFAAIGRRMINGEEGYRLITNKETGEISAVFYAPITSSDYSIGIRVPYQQVNQPVSQLIFTQAGVTIGAIFLVILTALFLSKKIALPIIALRDATNELAHGVWDSPVPTTGKDEVNDLNRAFCTMVASLKEREHSLAQSEERFALAMKGSNDGLWDWDLKSGEIYYSPRWKSMLGYKEDELINNHDSFETRVHPDDLAQVKQQIENHLSQKTKTFNIELRMRHKDGHYLDILSRGFVLRDDTDNQPLRFVGTHVDISKRKRAEIALIAAKDEAQRANETKNQFLSNMSHELRTPLNAIIGFADILSYNKDTHLSESEKSQLAEITSAGWHLLELINDILDLSRIETGDLHVELVDINLDELLDECEFSLAAIAKHRQISITRKLSCKNIKVIADRSRLKQVLLNLLSNAIKYNKENGKVIIDCEQSNNQQLKLNITDTGPGIDEDRHKELFEPFNRLDSDHSIDGTGIGLSITRQLINLMHGGIGLESKPGDGSTFWFTLPIADIADETNSNSQNSLPDQLKPNDPEHTVLCVEDNHTNMMLMKEILRHYQFIEAETGELGVELALKHKPDLILMDINLPGIDGTEALQQIRNNKETRNIPVIAVSGNALQSDIDLAMSLGFDDYLTKPVEIKHLLKTINQVLNG